MTPYSHLASGGEGLPTPGPVPLLPSPLPATSSRKPAVSHAWTVPGSSLSFAHLPSHWVRVFVILDPFSVDKGSLLGQTARVPLNCLVE